jgi:hypothetical protein
MNPASDDKPPFGLQAGYDQDELLGARWWHAASRGGSAGASQQRNHDQSRRTALQTLLALGGIAVLGTVAAGALRSRRRHTVTSGELGDVVHLQSLQLQQQQGLAHGATELPFAFPDAVARSVDDQPLDLAWFDRLAADLQPADPAWLPSYVPTLFQAARANGSESLRRDLRLVHNAAMQRAHDRAVAVRELLGSAEAAAKWLLVVDLPGPESVAFAAGLQPAVTAVFGFDNWPHPRGVVPAHLTLAATLYYRSRFLSPAPASKRPAALVLDRLRLSPYQNEPERFDNRHLAKLPTGTSLLAQGIERVLYVVPEGAEAVESLDLNERFVEYRDAGIQVRLLGLGDLQLADAPVAAQPLAGQPTTTTAGASQPAARYYWGGGPRFHGWFWHHYDWPSRPGPTAAERPPVSAFGSGYRPTARPMGSTGLSQLGRTPQPRPRSSGGSLGRTSGGFGG